MLKVANTTLLPLFFYISERLKASLSNVWKELLFKYDRISSNVIIFICRNSFILLMGDHEEIIHM